MFSKFSLGTIIKISTAKTNFYAATLNRVTSFAFTPILNEFIAHDVSGQEK